MPDLDITQYEVTGHLGRHRVLDPRSLAYRRPYTGQPLHPVEWAPKVPVLNQQDLIGQGIHTSDLYEGIHDMDALGSCTANAATALISVLHDADPLDAAGLDVTDAAAAETWAIGLYSDATHRDQWHDQAWPSSDCGSSGLGVAKALRARGLIDQYQHATTGEELCALLQSGPVLMGMPWLAAFSEANTDGFVDAHPAWATSPVEGGHEVCLIAVDAIGHDDGVLLPEHTVLRFRQSWGASWGDHGDGRLFLSTYLALRHEVDLVAPRLDTAR